MQKFVITLGAAECNVKSATENQKVLGAPFFLDQVECSKDSLMCILLP
jgi:hypothetical protein